MEIQFDAFTLDTFATVEHKGNVSALHAGWVMPESLGGKTDMNDILKQKGTQGVLDTLANRTISIDQKTLGMPDKNNLAGFKRNSDTDIKSAAKQYEQSKLTTLKERSMQQDNVLSQAVESEALKQPTIDRALDKQLQIEREL